MPPSFRHELATDLADRGVAVSSPLEVPVTLRGPLWRALCEGCANWLEANPDQRLHISRLLVNLGFYEYFLTLHESLEKRTESVSSGDRLRYEMAKIRIMRGSEDIRFAPKAITSSLAGLAKTFSASEPEFFICCLNLLLLNVTELKNLEQAKHWAGEAERALDHMRSTGETVFLQILFRSCWLRAFAMIPHAEGRLSEMKTIMRDCEILATSLCATDVAEEFLRQENLYSVYESAAKSALATKDWDLAGRYLETLAVAFPNDSKALITYGEFLMSKEDFRGAAAVYKRAANAAPLGAAIAWFMAGQAHDALNELPAALECYSRSLRSDPLAISALEALRPVAARLKIPIEANIASVESHMREMSEAESEYA